MATDPKDIRLRDFERKRIAFLANESGKDWTDLVTDMIDFAEATLRIKHGLESVSEVRVLMLRMSINDLENSTI